MKECSTPWRIKTPLVVVTNATQYNKDIKLLNNGLQDDYKVYCIAQGIKVVTTSFRDYSVLLKLFKQNTLEHFTYVLPKHKPFKAVLKGLNARMPCSDIKEEMEDRRFTLTDVRQLYSKSSLKSVTSRTLPIFVCTFAWTEEMQPNSSGMVTDQGRGVEESLNILFWNGNGIAQQEHKFRQLLGTYGVDVALICETHLSEQKKMRFYDYEFHRKYRTVDRGGGTAVLVRSNLVHYQTILPAMDYVESTSIAIPKGQKEIVFTAAYRSPLVPLTVDDLDRLTRVSNQASWTLAGLAETKNCTFLATKESMFYPSNYRILPDDLDVVLTDLDMLPEELETLNELDSDHLPVFGRIALKTNQKLSYVRRKITKSDWDEYRQVLTDAVPLNLEVNSPDEVDSSITLLTATLLEAYRETTVFETGPVLLKRDNLEISYLISRKREARRQWKHYWDPRHHAEYSRLRALVTRQLQGTKGKAGTTVIHGRRGLEYRGEAKAEAIVESFEDQFKANSEPQDEEFTRTVKRAVRVYLADPVIELPPPITRNEVTHQIDGKRSPLNSISAGVPQGSEHSRFLYTVYVADIPIDPMIKTQLFADDNLFYIANRNVNVRSSPPAVVTWTSLAVGWKNGG
uniref:Reverse transcriptase n=1 Tax=Timema cristinae TaxID=61476 RepID=A0A7R9H0Y9_TIMCR|nr:unnamed protein product [Timema cristinae]